MGNLINRPRIKLKLKSSCCTTVVTTPDENDPELGFELQLQVENGQDEYDCGTQLQRKDSAVESDSEKSK